MSHHQPSTINHQPPAGYKQTEVGVIPEEWEVRSLAEICSKITDGTHDTPTPIRSGVPFLTAIHIKENFIDYEACSFLTEEDHRIIFARCNPKRGDVLMVNIGAGVATTALVDVDFEFSLKNVALLKPADSRASGRFLNQCLIRRKSSITQALSSGGAQPFLSLSQIGQIGIPVPPLPEQRAIATALSDVDGLLDGLDRLIAKKRDLKQAAMQQLLTGQTRPPGFHDEWEVKSLGELSNLYQPQTISAKEFTESGFPVYGANGVVGYYHKANHDTWQVTITCRGSTCGTVNRTVEHCWITGNAMVLNSDHNPNLDKDFFYHLLSIQNMSDCITGTGQPQIVRAPITAFRVALPKTLAEQIAIAEVLTEMDGELAVLEQRREKTRALKQAMMQELLTGKTRLL
jgi:type I restriction enzyme S subunit